MNKKLSIIIPYHNEEEPILVSLFSSLNTQQFVNWEDVEIIMTNNCEVPRDLTNFFARWGHINPIIRYVECPDKGGMGTNRQFGLEQTTGEYVMFCDCDDVLYSPLSLHEIFCRLTPEIDMYDFICIKELDTRDLKKGAPVFELNGPNPVLLHGKVYRRQYLIDNHIHFTPRLFAWEDMFFNQALEMTSPSRKYFEIPIYIWKFRAASVSKEAGPEIVYQMKHWKDGILKNYYVLDFMKKYNVVSKEKFFSILTDTVIDWYRRRHENSYKIQETAEMYGYTIKMFDPDLTHVLNAQVRPVGTDESYYAWVRRITSNLDMKAIDKKFSIGHIDHDSY